MKVFVILSGIVALAAASKPDYYVTGNDHLDVDNVMHNRQTMIGYLNCFIDIGPCDQLAQSYKMFITFSALVAFVAAAHPNYFVTGNDHLDVDQIMGEPNIMTGYLNCFLDEGPCDALAQSYKKNLPDAFRSACSRCSDDQKHLVYRFLDDLPKDYPAQYIKFLKKYDPQKKYIDALRKAVWNH
ncbi:unnamed protein product [Leptidea sinapis]|uniref:Uncharacterized protein n=1 Tax=Leptidea sinapis TaxID=189913 RepID=A0A5E4QKJ7_9NEOP|nr:unnamed protein product [Leptidea sinapis]